MVTITPPLSVEQRQDLEKVKTETIRLYHLPDAWLANSLLKMARCARQAAPQYFGNPNFGSFGASLLWEVIPTIARQLSSAVKFEDGESLSYEILNMTANQKRSHFWSYLTNIGFDNLSYGPELGSGLTPAKMAFRLLGKDPADGNPICFGIDRVCPPQNGDDFLSLYMLSTSEQRGHDPVSKVWTPDFQLCYARIKQIMREDVLGGGQSHADHFAPNITA